MYVDTQALTARPPIQPRTPPPPPPLRPPPRFRKAGAGCDQDAPEPWQADLASLSGGQRTLVSLALLLSAARAAGAAGGGCGLFILDEADAALDEHNQVGQVGAARGHCRGRTVMASREPLLVPPAGPEACNLKE